MNKKGITLIEILVTVAILATALLSVFVFSTKVKNKTAVENNMLDVFYNNVSAFEIIQKELNLTGNIDKAITSAIKETKGLSGKYMKTLEIEVNPIIIVPDKEFESIQEADSSLEKVYKNKDEIDYYKKDSVRYYKSGLVSPKFNLSHNVPIYRISINTKLGVNKWDKLAVTSLVCPNGGNDVYR